MKKISMSEIIHEVWGRCLRIENGIIELEVTLEFGPRIIKYALSGGENVFHEDFEKKLAFRTESFGKFKKDEDWILYGGHRLWVGPQKDPHTYYPDNVNVSYLKQGEKVVFRQEREEWTGIRKELEVEIMQGSPRVIVKHRLYNEGAWDITCYLWAISAMAGGECIIPQCDDDTGAVENRIIKLWKYSGMLDKRVRWGDKYIRLKQIKGLDSEFKIGTNNTKGWALYLQNKNIFIKHFSKAAVDGTTNFEAYINSDFLEIESLSPLREIKTGSFAEHEEQWEIYANDSVAEITDDEIDRMITAIT